MLPGGIFSGLLTDLRELVTVAGRVQNRFDSRAAFEFFLRQPRRNRGYRHGAGLEQVIDLMGKSRFSSDEVSNTWTLSSNRRIVTSRLQIEDSE